MVDEVGAGVVADLEVDGGGMDEHTALRLRLELQLLWPGGLRHGS